MIIFIHSFSFRLFFFFPEFPWDGSGVLLPDGAISPFFFPGRGSLPSRDPIGTFPIFIPHLAIYLVFDGIHCRKASVVVIADQDHLVAHFQDAVDGEHILKFGRIQRDGIIAIGIRLHALINIVRVL